MRLGATSRRGTQRAEVADALRSPPWTLTLPFVVGAIVCWGIAIALLLQSLQANDFHKRSAMPFLAWGFIGAVFNAAALIRRTLYLRRQRRLQGPL